MLSNGNGKAIPANDVAPTGAVDATMIEVDGLAKTFPSPGGDGDLTVFNEVNFKVKKGEFVCLIGHSGCGKSTLLNILAGLDTPSAGFVCAAGKEIAGPGLDRAVVFQGHVLMPWMTVMANVTFAVRSRWPEWSRTQVREQAEKYLEMVDLEDAYRKKPSQLSGGMKQRVGIARALAIEPKILLLDEPFGALDALTRGSIQEKLTAICRTTEQTVFMITHDIDEAMLLADRILLMTNGPEARLCEVVVNTLPKDRERQSMHHHPNFYPMRNHLMDFLVNRSKAFAEIKQTVDPTNVPQVHVTADDVTSVTAENNTDDVALHPIHEN